MNVTDTAIEALAVPARLPRAAPSGTRLALLGGFRLHHDGVALSLPVHAQRLLAYLGLAEQSSRTLTAGTLWPDVGEQRALGNLRSALWRVQRICPAVVDAGRTRLALAPGVEVDARRCRETASRLTHAGTTWEASEVARGSLCGELLPGWYDDWVLAERDRLQHLRLYALEAASEILLREGRFGEALEAAFAAVREDPLRESCRRLVLRVHVAEGNRVEALRQFQSYRALLAAELGIEPSPRTWAVLNAPG